MMYIQDYDEMMPQAQQNHYSDEGSDIRVDYPFLLMPYIKSAQVFDCPSQSFSGSSYTNYGGETSYRRHLSYHQNVRLGSMGQNPPHVRLAAVVNPSITPLHWDGNHQGTVDGWWNNTDYIDDRHNEMFNCSFVDGHVKSLNKSQALSNLTIELDP